MAHRALQPCIEPGCKKLTRAARCEQCTKEHSGPPRATKTERGYCSRWSRVARLYRQKHPLCETCLRFGRSSPAQCVDHIIPMRVMPELKWLEDNWQSLCWPCHSTKTNKEQSMQPWLPWQNRYVVTGKRATGKSTWVREHARSGDWVWDWDVEAKRYGWRWPLDREQMDHMYRARAKLIDEIARSQDKERQAFVIVHYPAAAAEVASRIKARLKWCTCDEVVREERLRNRNDYTVASLSGGMVDGVKVNTESNA